jgi:hypothetical protein
MRSIRDDMVRSIGGGHGPVAVRRIIQQIGYKNLPVDAGVAGAVASQP